MAPGDAVKPDCGATNILPGHFTIAPGVGPECYNTPMNIRSGKRAGFTAAAVVLAGTFGCRAIATPKNALLPDGIDLDALLRAHPEMFGDILEHADELRLKIELAVVTPGPDGLELVRDSVDYGPDYFYPASSVKTCAVLAAFRTIADLARETGAPIDRNTALRFHPLFDGEQMEITDPSHVDGGAITAAHDARKVLLVSDNAAYNRLYELSGARRDQWDDARGGTRLEPHRAPPFGVSLSGGPTASPARRVHPWR